MEPWKEELAELRSILIDKERFAKDELSELRSILIEKERFAMEQMKEMVEKLKQEFAQDKERERIAREEREKERAEREKQERIAREQHYAMIDKTYNKVFEINTDVNGIKDSNGRRTESYFYNSLCDIMKFGDYEFDEIDKGLRKLKKLPDGSRIQGQYDVIMYNGNTIALIEVKNRARKEDVQKLVNEQINKFKIFYPQFANYTFLLGIAADSFEDEAEIEAKAQGVGMLLPKGNILEIIDGHLKPF